MAKRKKYKELIGGVASLLSGLALVYFSGATSLSLSSLASWVMVVGIILAAYGTVVIGEELVKNK